MRMPWDKAKEAQLDLVDAAGTDALKAAGQTAAGGTCKLQLPGLEPMLSVEAAAAEGVPLQVPVGYLEEDPANPCTEFPDEEIRELASDIALRGILQPIVVRRTAEQGRYRVIFGAKRLRAAKQAKLETVPVVIGSDAHDAYAQVAENQKRHGLTPLDLARFMRSRADAGDSNAEIARRMGIDLTSVAHHLALLSLPPELDEALRNGRCTSPRTLYELAKLQKTKPEQVKAIVSGDGEITRKGVAALKKGTPRSCRSDSSAGAVRHAISLVAHANDLCARLETLLERMSNPGSAVTPDELAALRRRVARLGTG